MSKLINSLTPTLPSSSGGAWVASVPHAGATVGGSSSKARWLESDLQENRLVSCYVAGISETIGFIQEVF